MNDDLWFAIPGELGTLTGGYIYDRRLIEALRAHDMNVHHLAWPAGFPFPGAAEQRAAATSLASVPDGGTVLIDGLAYGALPDLAHAEGERLRLVALVHHPLALETGLGEAARFSLAETERRALSCARAVITTSRSTAETLGRCFGVPSACIGVAEPGTDPVDPRAPRTPDGVVRLLSVGAVVPRKGYDVLAASLAALADLPWACVIAGSLDRVPDAAAALRAQIEGSGLSARIVLAGEVTDVGPLYRAADLFVLASWHEGYGMAFAEALRHGLPIVGIQAGAIPDLVPDSAGVLVAPGDSAALAAALRRLIGNPTERARLAAGAALAACSLPSWEDTAGCVADVIRQVREAPAGYRAVSAAAGRQTNLAGQGRTARRRQACRSPPAGEVPRSAE